MKSVFRCNNNQMETSRFVSCVARFTERKDKQKGVARPAVRMQMPWKLWNFKGMKRKRHTPTKNIQSSAEGKRSGVESKEREEKGRRKGGKGEKGKAVLFISLSRKTFFALRVS